MHLYTSHYSVCWPTSRWYIVCLGVGVAWMSQLGRFIAPCQDTSGNASIGCSVYLYREGASVNGAASGASPLTVNVRHRGKIATGDSVFVNSASGTTYTAT